METTKRCDHCGREFAARHWRKKMCSPECSHAHHLEVCKAHYRRYRADILVLRKNENRSPRVGRHRTIEPDGIDCDVATVPVECQCPRCGVRYTLRLAPVRAGHVPRIYCGACRAIVRSWHIEPAAAVGYY